MKKMRVLITAGPTREAIDPVRFISNRSSGKMGYAIAEAALAAGHSVVLVSGPVHLPAPAGAEVIRVESAREMFEAVRDRIAGCDAAIFSAAVSDYRAARIALHKIKKNADRLVLELEKTEDILGSCRQVFGYQGILAGFAAETEHLLERAREKMERKGCDFLVANDVSRPDIGFDRDENEVTILSRTAPPVKLEYQGKKAIGEALIRMIEAAGR